MDKLVERLLDRDDALIIQEIVPHPAVKQMSDRMLRTADIQIDRHPVF